MSIIAEAGDKLVSAPGIIGNNSVTAAPSLAYLGTVVASVPIPTFVSLLTGVLVLFQIYKTVIEIRAAKRKESEACKASDKG